LQSPPAGLAPLIQRPQWCVWKWTERGGKWQKPPYRAKEPDRHASVTDPSTWSDFEAARAAVAAGEADGVSYVLTADDPYCAIDLDHCRTDDGMIAEWAQDYAQKAKSYCEITPSGAGLRIWGNGGGEPLHINHRCEIDGTPIGVELFRATNKALTITGAELNRNTTFANLAPTMKWAVKWIERHQKPEKPQDESPGLRAAHSPDEIDRIVREGGDGDRSALFHTAVGHYLGCDWSCDRIVALFEQHPGGIAERYIAEDRLAQEVERSWIKYGRPEPAVEDELPGGEEEQELPGAEEEIGEQPSQVEDDLPPLFVCGEPGQMINTKWLIKGLIPETGVGLLSGQWGTFKTFSALELARSAMTMQPYCGRRVKRQCAVLWFAAEGQHDIEQRIAALLKEKNSGSRLPIAFYKQVPPLLHRGSLDKLARMVRKAAAELDRQFGLPVGLIFFDTVPSCAGYSKAGANDDNAVGQALINILRQLAQEAQAFVLGVEHFGKNIEAGTKGASAKEDAADVVLACLGEKQIDGSVQNTRLAIRKVRAGEQGKVVAFTTRVVDLGTDEDGDKITSRVIEWGGSTQEASPPPPPDPWQSARRDDQQASILRLKDVLHEALAQEGVEKPVQPGGPSVRMVQQQTVRMRFYERTPIDGEGDGRERDQYRAAVGFAEKRKLIHTGESEGEAFFWLGKP
jgi:hypothetical protein